MHIPFNLLAQIPALTCALPGALLRSPFLVLQQLLFSYAKVIIYSFPCFALFPCAGIEKVTSVEAFPELWQWVAYIRCDILHKVTVRENLRSEEYERFSCYC